MELLNGGSRVVSEKIVEEIFFSVTWISEQTDRDTL